MSLDGWKNNEFNAKNSIDGVIIHIAIGAGGLRFDFRAAQTGHRGLTTAVTFIWSYVAQALSRVDKLATCYTLRHNIASVLTFTRLCRLEGAIYRSALAF